MIFQAQSMKARSRGEDVEARVIRARIDRTNVKRGKAERVKGLKVKRVEMAGEEGCGAESGRRKEEKEGTGEGRKRKSRKKGRVRCSWSLFETWGVSVSVEMNGWSARAAMKQMRMTNVCVRVFSFLGGVGGGGGGEAGSKD